MVQLLVVIVAVEEVLVVCVTVSWALPEWHPEGASSDKLEGLALEFPVEEPDTYLAYLL